MAQRIGSTVLLVAWAGLLLAGAAVAGEPVELPATFTVPTNFREETRHRQYLEFTETAFDFQAPGERAAPHQKVQGHVWQLGLTALDPALASDVEGTAAAMAQTLQREGWTVLTRQDAVVARRGAAPGGLWLSGAGNGTFFRVTLVQRADLSRRLTLTPPAAQPETLAAEKDVPYAPPFPGATVAAGAGQTRAFDIYLPGMKGVAQATPTVCRWYDAPAGLSAFEFVEVYRRALEPAGWTVAHTQVASEGQVVAHYEKAGRDVWLSTSTDGAQQTLCVADIGAEATGARLMQQLGSAGHVALHGVYFDYASVTPRPESEVTLKQVLALLNAEPGLSLEVQGHTDIVGAAADNEALSAARAAAVKKWLVDHGIAAARLTSKGYGSTVPVADNAEEEGRARNRRVELSRR